MEDKQSGMRTGGYNQQKAEAAYKAETTEDVQTVTPERFARLVSVTGELAATSEMAFDVLTEAHDRLVRRTRVAMYALALAAGQEVAERFALLLDVAAADGENVFSSDDAANAAMNRVAAAARGF